MDKQRSYCLIKLYGDEGRKQKAQTVYLHITKQVNSRHIVDRCMPSSNPNQFVFVSKRISLNFALCLLTLANTL